MLIVDLKYVINKKYTFFVSLYMACAAVLVHVISFNVIDAVSYFTECQSVVRTLHM